jgi:photosystem II stability/assembly factor-like uncharacterized protein
MSKHFLSCLGFCLLGFTAQAQWVYQPISGISTQAAPLFLDAIDANTAWGVSVGENAYVVPQLVRTTNAGQTWTVTNLPVSAPVGEDATAMAAVSATTAWVTTANILGSGGRILRTTDSGQTWTTQSSATVFGNADSYPSLIRFFSATEGVALGGKISGQTTFEGYVTADAGQTWTPLATLPTLLANEDIMPGVPAIQGNTIWFLTSQGRVFRSRDKGLTWTATAVASNLTDPTSIAFRDAQNGLVSVLDESSTNHQLYQTTNGGTNWTSVAYTGPLHGGGLSAVPGTTEFVSTGADLDNGDQGSSFTRDNGQTWISLENTRNHLGVEFVSATVGWSGGFAFGSGTQLTGGVNRYAGTALATRTDAALQASLSVSPNPATGGRFMLQTSRNTSSASTVRVLDVAGRLVQQQAWNGSTALALDLSTEPAGLYVLEVQGASGTARQKVVVQ